MSFTASQYEQLLEVVGSIYESVIEPGASHPAIEEIRQLHAAGGVPPGGGNSAAVPWRSPQGWAALVPHLKRAAELQARLRHHDIAAGSFKIVGFLPTPAAIVDRKGKLLASNDAGAAALREMGVLHGGGNLKFRAPGQQERWEEALDRATTDKSAASVSVPDGPSLSWHLRITPWALVAPGDAKAGASSYLLVIERLGGPSLRQAGAFAARWKLTRAESEVLELLVRGLSAKDVTQQRGSTMNTVRTQIAAILEKTRCRTQRELLARVQASQ